MNHFTLTAGALRRRKARTVFTGLSVLVVFILFGLAMALRHGFAVGPSLAGNNMIIVSPQGQGELPIGIVPQITAVSGVRNILPIGMMLMQYQDPKNRMPVSGMPPQAFLINYQYQHQGQEPPAAATWKADRIGALVAQSYLKAHDLDWKVGQTIVLTPPKGSTSKPLSIKIDGILPPSKNGMSFNMPVTIHLKYLNAWRNKDTISAMFVMAADASRVDAVADAITHRFANSTHPLKAQALHAVLQSVLQRVGNVGALTMAVIAAALLSLLFVTGNAVAQSVNERRSEFALFKALGFSRRRIGSLVFGETVLLTAPPALIGLALAGWLIAAMMSATVQLPDFQLGAAGYLIGIGVIAMLIVISALAPLVAVVRLTGAKAMRAA